MTVAAPLAAPVAGVKVNSTVAFASAASGPTSACSGVTVHPSGTVRATLADASGSSTALTVTSAFAASPGVTSTGAVTVTFCSAYAR